MRSERTGERFSLIRRRFRNEKTAYVLSRFSARSGAALFRLRQEKNGTEKQGKAICQKVLAVSGFGPMYQVKEDEYLVRLENGGDYSIDPGRIAEWAWYVAENASSNVDEVRIFCTKDAEYAQEIAKIFEAQLGKRLRIFREQTITAQVEKLEKAEVVTQDRWVYFCVGENSAEMMDVIASEIRN